MRKHKGLMVISILVFAFLFIPLIIIAVTAFGSESTITFLYMDFHYNGLSMCLNQKAL